MKSMQRWEVIAAAVLKKLPGDQRPWSLVEEQQLGICGGADEGVPHLKDGDDEVDDPYVSDVYDKEVEHLYLHTSGTARLRKRVKRNGDSSVIR